MNFFCSGSEIWNYACNLLLQSNFKRKLGQLVALQIKLILDKKNNVNDK